MRKDEQNPHITLGMHTHTDDLPPRHLSRAASSLHTLHVQKGINDRLFLRAVWSANAEIHTRLVATEPDGLRTLLSAVFSPSFFKTC
jgi:hypothetical protein